MVQQDINIITPRRKTKMKVRGRFIVLYGANNLGKSHQLELLKGYLNDLDFKVVKIKYPIYDLEPTGPLINQVLRHGKKMDELSLQKLYSQNRRDFEPVVNKYLSEGTFLVAEDYTGTGIAWGMVRDVSLETLEDINKDLLKEDLSIILWGERFKDGVEKNHRNETDDQIWEKAQECHLMLAKRYGWDKVYASRSPEEVHRDILKIVNNKLNLV